MATEAATRRVREGWIRQGRVKPEWLADPVKRGVINALADMEAADERPVGPVREVELIEGRVLARGRL